MDVWAEIILLVLVGFAVLALSSISRYLQLLSVEITAVRIMLQGAVEQGIEEQARMN
jgi:hypothetical protein